VPRRVASLAFTATIVTADAFGGAGTLAAAMPAGTTGLRGATRLTTLELGRTRTYQATVVTAAARHAAQ
jgi:hypothetical protein